MIFRKKIKENDNGKIPSGFLKQLRSTFRGRLAFRILMAFIFLAIFGDFIANDKPIFAKRNGTIEFPVLKSYFVDLGWAAFDGEIFEKGWKELNYEKVVWPIIPYAASGLDFKNDRFRSPFGPQTVDRILDWHWLGTDQLGRDVTAGLIAGARSAILVGIIAMGLAAFIGISLGAIAGFFGDDKLRFGSIHLVLLSIGFLLGLFWIANANTLLPSLAEKPLLKTIGRLLLFTTPIFLFGLLGKMLERFRNETRYLAIPVDLIIMRIIEILNSIPGLLLLLAIVALVEQPNIYTVMLIIGFLSWTGITRFMRGELLKVRTLPFMQSVESMGFSTFRKLFRHAIPNALGPVIVTITFGIAGAILTESVLSFIGIATSPDKVTWGTLLNAARSNISAWWLAVLPGLMIFLMITSLNIIGDQFNGFQGKAKT